MYIGAAHRQAQGREAGGRRSEVRGRKLEVGSRRSEVRNGNGCETADYADFTDLNNGNEKREYENRNGNGFL